MDKHEPYVPPVLFGAEEEQNEVEISSFPTECHRHEEQGISGDKEQKIPFPLSDESVGNDITSAPRHADVNRHPNTGGEMDTDLYRSDENGDSRHSCEGRNPDNNA